MKKHTASLMTAAMLLTLAWMTGCDSGKTAESSKAATTTALETTAEVVTDAVETTAAEESSAADAQRFDNYADFAAAMAEQHPELTLYTPPESVQQQWEWKSIMLGQTSYQYEMYSAEKQATVNVLIDMQPSFTNAQEIVDTLTKMGVTAKLIDDGCCPVSYTHLTLPTICSV